MVATIDWFLEAGRLLTDAEADAKAKLIEYHEIASKQIALLAISPTLRNEEALKQLTRERQKAGDRWDEASKQVLKILLLISKTPLHPQRIPLRAKLYWLWCCIKYRQL